MGKQKKTQDQLMKLTRTHIDAGEKICIIGVAVRCLNQSAIDADRTRSPRPRLDWGI